jgi:hypothetical protein
MTLSGVSGIVLKFGHMNPPCGGAGNVNGVWLRAFVALRRALYGSGELGF